MFTVGLEISLNLRKFEVSHKDTRERGFPGGSVVVCLPMQGTRARALVREDPTCSRATKPVCHNYWACTLEPASRNYRALMPQLLKPVRLEPVLCNKRSHHNEKPPLTATRESPWAATKTKRSQKKKKNQGKNIPGRGNSLWKSPKMITSLAFSRQSKGARMVFEWRVRGR